MRGSTARTGRRCRRSRTSWTRTSATCSASTTPTLPSREDADTRPLAELRTGCGSTAIDGPGCWTRSTRGDLHAAVIGKSDYPDTDPAEGMLLSRRSSTGTTTGRRSVRRSARSGWTSPISMRGSTGPPSVGEALAARRRLRLGSFRRGGLRRFLGRVASLTPLPGVVGPGRLGHRRRVKSATLDHHDRERRPLRAGERAEALVDPQEVLEEAGAAVPDREQQRRDPLAPGLADEPPEEPEQRPRRATCRTSPSDARRHPCAIVSSARVELGAAPLDDLDLVPLELGLAARPVADERRRQPATVVRPREEPGRRLAEVVADDEVADPSDRDPEGEGRRQRVGDLEEPEAEAPDVDRVRDRGSRDAAEERDPALPHVEPLERGGEIGRVGDHVRRRERRRSRRSGTRTTTELIASSEIPRRGASRPNSHAPIAKPIAMNSAVRETQKAERRGRRPASRPMRARGPSSRA